MGSEVSWDFLLGPAVWLAEAGAAVAAGMLAIRSRGRIASLAFAAGMLLVVTLQLAWSQSGQGALPTRWLAAQFGFALLALGALGLAARRELAESRARAAQALGEKQLRFLLDRVSEAYVIVEDGKISFASRAYRSIFGVAAEEAIGGRFEDLILPSSLPAYRDRYNTTPLSVGANRVELEAARADGENRWIETTFQITTWDGRPAELVCVADITERRKAQDDLRESEERFRGLVENAVIGIYRTARDGRVLMANPALATMLGFATASELVGRNLRDWAAPDGESRASFIASLERDGVVGGFESLWTRPDGQRMFVRENARVILTENGEIECYEGSVEDLTVQHELSRQLVQAQKLEAVGRLAGGVAHDFNNLLQAILRSVHLVRRAGGDPQRNESRLTEIEDNVSRGAQLTRQLLLFSRRGASQFDNINLNDVVNGATRLLRRLLREDIALNVELSLEPVPVIADRGQLEQVIMNLALNGADAMPDGGTLTLGTARAEDGGALLTVRDTGEGIPEIIRERIFEPFFSTKPTDKGTGLGLSVVHGIISRHGGRIEFESEVNRGTTFRILLPPAQGVQLPLARNDQSPS